MKNVTTAIPNLSFKLTWERQSWMGMVYKRVIRRLFGELLEHKARRATNLLVSDVSGDAHSKWYVHACVASVRERERKSRALMELFSLTLQSKGLYALRKGDWGNARVCVCLCACDQNSLSLARQKWAAFCASGKASVGGFGAAASSAVAHRAGERKQWARASRRAG